MDKKANIDEILSVKEISKDEEKEFARVKENIDKISVIADTLQLWANQVMDRSKISKDNLKRRKE